MYERVYEMLSGRPYTLRKLTDGPKGPSLVALTAQTDSRNGRLLTAGCPQFSRYRTTSYRRVATSTELD